MPDYSKAITSCLVRALLAAQEAGCAIVEVYNSDFAVEHKDDKSPLTAADRRSHEIIAERLSSASERYPILSEEGRNIPFDERRNWEYFWLVDPLDGTKEFIKRNGEFTVNIALMFREAPVIGVIYVPVTDTFYFGSKETGAYKLDRGGRIKDLESRAQSDGDLLDGILKEAVKLPAVTGRSVFTVIGSRSHMSEETTGFIEALRSEHPDLQMISAGSSLKFCLVAEGSADIYPRFGPTMEWDTAAGQAIVEAVRGEVLHMNTRESLRYNKANLLNPGFIARKKA